MLKSFLLDICLCVCFCSGYVRLFATLWTVDLQTPLSMGFSKQEYWSRLPCSPPRNLPQTGTEPTSPASPALQVDSLPLSPWGKKPLRMRFNSKICLRVVNKVEHFKIQCPPQNKEKGDGYGIGRHWLSNVYLKTFTGEKSWRKEEGQSSINDWPLFLGVLHTLVTGAPYLRWQCFYLVAQMVKNLPAIQQTWVQSLRREDSPEKGMATHCSTLAWKIPWTEESGGLQSMGSQRVGHDWATSIFTRAL